MTFFLLLPVVLSFLLLAAHFLRAGNIPLVGLCLLIPWLLLFRRRWVVRVIQASLLLGAFEWLRTTVIIIQERQEEQRDWLRSAIILGGVMVFTTASGLVFAARPLRRWLSRSDEPNPQS